MPIRSRILRWRESPGSRDPPPPPPSRPPVDRWSKRTKRRGISRARKSRSSAQAAGGSVSGISCPASSAASRGWIFDQTKSRPFADHQAKAAPTSRGSSNTIRRGSSSTEPCRAFPVPSVPPSGVPGSGVLPCRPAGGFAESDLPRPRWTEGAMLRPDRVRRAALQLNRPGLRAQIQLRVVLDAHFPALLVGSKISRGREHRLVARVTGARSVGGGEQPAAEALEVEALLAGNRWVVRTAEEGGEVGRTEVRVVDLRRSRCRSGGATPRSRGGRGWSRCAACSRTGPPGRRAGGCEPPRPGSARGRTSGRPGRRYQVDAPSARVVSSAVPMTLRNRCCGPEERLRRPPHGLVGLDADDGGARAEQKPRGDPGARADVGYDRRRPEPRLRLQRRGAAAPGSAAGSGRSRRPGRRNALSGPPPVKRARPAWPSNGRRRTDRPRSPR